MSSILVKNQRPNVLDLSGVEDVNGRPVVLNPKDTAGDTRECAAEMEDHPHLVRVREPGWVSVTRTAVAQPKVLAAPVVEVTPIPAPPVVAVTPAPEPAPAPEPVVDVKPEPEPEPALEPEAKPVAPVFESRKNKRR